MTLAATHIADAPRTAATVSTRVTLTLAIVCGLLAANLYYAQPLAGPISAALGLSPSAAGLIVTLTQIGYGLGLFLIVPLGDLLENRRLTLVLIGIAALGLVGAGLSGNALSFLAATSLVGVGTVALQVLVPYAAHLSPEATRGRVVGNVMSGVMLGIMLARPTASFVTGASSWRVIFLAASVVMLLLVPVLLHTLPVRVPTSKLGYGALLASMGALARHTPVLRRRSLYHAAMFGAFSLFWTTAPLQLLGPFHLSQRGVGLFALAGVTGAVAAPIAGRVADRGWTRAATGLAMVCVAAAFLLTRLGMPGSPHGLATLVVGGVLLDFGVSANMTLSQREIFALDAEYRARMNGIYMTTFFTGAAVCSALGGWAFAHGGWSLTSWVGVALPVIALAYWATE